MTVFGLVLSTTLPWALIHLIRTLYARSNHKRRTNSLPLPLLGDASASRSGRGNWDIGPLWLKYETTRWNTFFSTPFSFSRVRRRQSLESREVNPKLARWGVWLYAVGAALCVFMMVLGMILLFWSTAGVLWRVVHLLVGGDQGRAGVKKLVKRSLEDAVVVEPEKSSLHALIPGITVPLSHLPILLCGLAVSGVIHEAGHAITASLENVPVLSTGLHIHLVFPTFFVALSEGTLVTLPTPSRLRIATAGAWHNLITWALLALFGFSVFSISDLYPLSSPSNGLTDNEVCLPASASSCSSSIPALSHNNPSSFWYYLGYENALRRGIVITHVESDSPLYGHLIPGSVVTRIDDLRLGGMDDRGLSGNAFNKWSGHLSMTPEAWTRKVEEEAGWCVPQDWFNHQSNACCHDSPGESTAHHHENEGPDSCFSTFQSTSDGMHKKPNGERCLDPVSLFTYQHSLGRGKAPKNPAVSNGIQGKSGSLYGSRCHVACLRADGDDQEYFCARPRVHANSAQTGIDPSEERLLRLEIEDPPWAQKASETSSPRNEVTPETGVPRGGPPPSHEHRIDPNHRQVKVRPTRILVYKGPTSEILSHVSVGPLQPRSRHLPLLFPHYIGTSIPALFSLFWEYVARLSLSLAFFNLLPIMGLDGGAVLSCLLEWWLGSGVDANGAEEYDVELLERGVDARRHTSWKGSVTKRKEKIEKSASILTIVLGMVVAIATLWQDVG